MSTPEKDPLRALSSRTLRQIGRHLKIKHYYRKSPSKLRRAIRRSLQRKVTPEQSASARLEQLIQKFTRPAKPTKPETRSVAPKTAQTPAKKSILTREQEVEARRAAERKAYEEHRLRYLFSPSRFVHKGTHDDYILEKDEDIELPDFYAEKELVALPIDPFRFYVYWDFDTPLEADVKDILNRAPDVFMLKVSDVTGVMYNGENAHNYELLSCDPLSREFYVNTRWHDRNLCVELVYRHAKGLETLLRSNTVYIPPATVSPVRQDRFAHFVPAQPVVTDRLVSKDSANLALPEPVESSAAPRELVTAFFEDYTPTPVQFNPRPPRSAQTQETETPSRPVATGFVDPVPVQWRPPPSRAVFLKPPEPPKPQPVVESTPGPVQHHTAPVQGMNEEATESWLTREGGQQMSNWLGLPFEVRWFSDIPTDALPMMFEQWITDPYDQALMISYAIWPWEVTEYMPLGSSDWTLRKFLGASLFSWFRPGGSERMLRWTTQPAGSERVRWLQPQGASEVHWSGSLQPVKQQDMHPWELWPKPVSGSGVFG